MNIVCGWLLFIIVVLSSCKKQLPIAEDDNCTMVGVVRSDITKIPGPHVPLVICINSYDELMQQLGAGQITVRGAVLNNGVMLRPGSDLHFISYEAVPQNQPNSLFGSRLIVEWRYPGGDWQINTSDVWSLGCVYQVAGEPPYTNIIKGRKIIEINTCFFWQTNVFTGERIAYLVID